MVRKLRCLPVLVSLLGLGVLTPGAVAAQEWHELYADGQQALRTGRFEQAVQLFRGAIQKRPQPGVSVPTYGTNFEPRYYPYLRLAEAYLRLEAYDEVLKTLEVSARYGVEPAADRSALESRARVALDAKRPRDSVKLATPPSLPSPGPPPESSKNPPPETSKNPPPLPIPAPVVEVPKPNPTTRSSPSPSVTEPPRTTVSSTLDLTSDPPGAQVYIDDMPVGRTDPQSGRLRLTALRPGKHRLRLSAEGREDLVREIALGSEPLTFHGALAISERLPDSSPAASVPATENPPRKRWPTGGLILIVALLPSLWLWRRARSRGPRIDATETVRPRSVVPAVTEMNSYENFPVDFGEYHLVRRIGKGGMASVYEAERGNERFALKRPLLGFLDDQKFLERFSHEAELGRSLHHPNIVRIVDRGYVRSIPYFAMELVDGETLRARLDREGRIDPALATSITAQVAEALDYAHHKGVIHRDLKPSNIMLERSGVVKVMDYGIARAQFQEGVTTTGAFIGTPQYSAPEAVDGRTDPKSDLYSLGVVYFEMLTGSLPFTGENPLALLLSHSTTPPPVPSSLNYALTKEIDSIVLRLLSKEPSERPSAEELLNQLTDYQKRHR